MKIITIKNIVLSILISMSVVACEKDSVVEVPVTNPELVTACFLSPSADETTLRLLWSAPIFHTTVHDNPEEEDAKVYINDGVNSYQMMYNHSRQLYAINNNNLKIVEGKKYSLKVESSKSKTLYAETIIPKKPVYSISFTGYDSLHSPYDSPAMYTYKYYVKLNITNAESTAYYRVNCWGFVGGGAFGMSDYISLYPNPKENMIIHGNYSGTIFMIRSWQDMSRIKRIIVSLQKVDETYYRYHHALENYQGIDLFSEPTLVYSNVDNGLGVFCSYNPILDSVIVK